MESEYNHVIEKEEEDEEEPTRVIILEFQNISEITTICEELHQEKLKHVEEKFQKELDESNKRRTDETFVKLRML